MNQEASLFDKEERRLPRILAVCFNRTLVPLVEKKVDTAYRQRTGSSLPKGVIEFFNFNGLMYHLSKRGLWRYQKVFGEGMGDKQRVEQYLKDLTYVKQNEPNTFEQSAYDAIYCDEGQDFSQEEFHLLKELCLPKEKEPSLFVFYDDAQNLYGCKRPNWQSLGLNVLGGRSTVMTDCFRNTQPIVDLAFNVLYGSFADKQAKAPSKAFGDVQTLVDKGLLVEQEGRYLVSFAKRTGLDPIVTLAKDEEAEAEHLLKRIRWLIEEQEVRVEDILVLSWRKERLQRLAEYIARAHIASIPNVHLAFQEKDDMLGQRRRLTLSTVNSAKGYDAYCVLLASANEFKPNVDGRAAFYVGCTRAIEYLEISGYADTGLLAEAKAWRPGQGST